MPTPAQILKRLDRLRALRSIGIPSDWARKVHQNRLLQMARQAAAMNVWHLRQLEPKRRYATLVAVALDQQQINSAFLVFSILFLALPLRAGTCYS